MSVLMKYDAACQAIAEAVSVDEVKNISDKALAIQAYARQARNKDLETKAAEIRIRAERRLGELIKAQKETVGLATGGQPYQSTGSKSEPVEKRPTLAQVGIDKKLSAKAQKLASVPEEKFERMLGDWRERIQKENERVTTNLLREGERAQRDEQLPKPTIPEGTFSVIYADPPWKYEFSETTSREIENQYPTMDLDDIKKMKIPSHENSVLFLWATAPKLKEALEVMESWGFEYRTNAIWDKEKIGMGYWFRIQHELLLVGRKGNFPPPIPENRISSVIHFPRMEHSQKPDLIYHIIESMYPNEKFLEIFARQKREKWEAWGNQA